MVWLLNKLGLVKGIYLRDREGDVYKTWIRKNPFKDLEGNAHVYPFTRVGKVLLYKDGTTGGWSSYIKQWKYMDDARNH